MKDDERGELLMELASSLIRAIPWFFGVPVTIPVGLLVILAKRYREYFSEDFFKASVGRVRGKIARNTRLINDVLAELEHARSLGSARAQDLLEVRVNQLEEKLELLEDKRIALNLALMVRERVEFYEKEFGKGIWKKISKYPQKVWSDTFRKTLEKHNKEKMNMKAFRDAFLADVEKRVKT